METDYCFLPKKRRSSVNLACTLSGAARTEPANVSRVFVLNSYISKIDEIPESTFSGASETLNMLYHNSLCRILKSAPSAEQLVNKLCKSASKHQFKYQRYKPVTISKKKKKMHKTNKISACTFSGAAEPQKKTNKTKTQYKR